MRFSWIYYIARAKLNLNDKEVGRLTFGQFNGLYKAYKETFDLELMLTLSRTTYAKLKAKADESEEWLH